MALVVFKWGIWNVKNFFFLCLMYVLISNFCLDLRVVSVSILFCIGLEVNVGKIFFGMHVNLPAFVSIFVC